MVIAPAKTGRDSNSKIAVRRTDHTNNGISSISIEVVRMLIIVVMKLIAPRIEEAPAICSEKIVRSTLDPLCAK
jgi:hypothetical protein